MSKDKPILWYSDGMHVLSGFGKVTRNVVLRLANLGWKIICYNRELLYGHAYLGNVLNLASAGEGTEALLIPMYCKFFNIEYMITLYDCWAMKWIDKVLEQVPKLKWFAYEPIECPLDESMEQKVKPLEKATKIIAMSQFGFRELLKLFPEDKLAYIPHGVDTKLYRILPDEERRKARESFGFSEHHVVFGFIGVNWGDRKGIPELMKAFSIFIENNPDARKEVYLLMWTNEAPAEGKSYGIFQLAKKYGITSNVKVPEWQPPQLFYMENDMVTVYNVIDCFVTCSRGEGFGLPTLEAHACGRPVIAPKNSTFPELVVTSELLCRVVTTVVPITYPPHGEFPIVDVYDVADKMAKVYNNVHYYRKIAHSIREKVLMYDYDVIVKKYWVPFLEKNIE